MSNGYLFLFFAVGAAMGSAGAYVLGCVFLSSGPTSLGLWAFLRIALAGALMAAAGGVIDRSFKKLLTGSITGALALVIILLLMQNAGSGNMETDFFIAFILALAGGVGALLSIMYSLMDEAYYGLSYAAILGAIGGLIGLALGFFLVAGPAVNMAMLVTFGALYGGCVWIAVGFSKKLEIIEFQESRQGEEKARNHDTPAT